jgi:multidrug resistance efflux pump
MAVAKWRRHHVIAVSGLDTIDRRAEEIKSLGRLATVVAAARKPLWHTGGKQYIPPQIERHLDAYLDRSHATLLAVIPLYPPEDDGSLQPQGTRKRAPIGTLIIEQLSDNRLKQGMVERTETVAAHSASAFCNALEHESLFLMPLWKALGRSKWIVRARTLPKIVLAFAAVLAVLAGLVLVPTDFELSARGKLQPAVRRDIFAHIDGVVVEVPARHEQLVQPEEVLVRLTNNSLDVELSNLVGRQRTTQERIQNAQRAQLDAQHSSIEEQNRLAGELLELRQVAESLDRELALLRQQEKRLVVRSAMHGQVVTWNVGEALLGRPVQKGQLLMTLVDPSGDWELELYMPERRMGHVARAAGGSMDGLSVTYMLASHPDRQFTGRVVEIQRKAEVRGEDGNCVLMRVAIDRHDLPDMRSETTVTARVHCGRRPAGYVLFHELIETVQSKVLFWF